jgi:hypothetical protein
LYEFGYGDDEADNNNNNNNNFNVYLQIQKVEFLTQLRLKEASDSSTWPLLLLK